LSQNEHLSDEKLDPPDRCIPECIQTLRWLRRRSDHAEARDLDRADATIGFAKHRRHGRLGRIGAAFLAIESPRFRRLLPVSTSPPSADSLRTVQEESIL
jgi:hypothetical protein